MLISGEKSEDGSGDEQREEEGEIETVELSMGEANIVKEDTKIGGRYCRQIVSKYGI